MERKNFWKIAQVIIGLGLIVFGVFQLIEYKEEVTREETQRQIYDSYCDSPYLNVENNYLTNSSYFCDTFYRRIVNQEGGKY